MEKRSFTPGAAPVKPVKAATTAATSNTLMRHAPGHYEPTAASLAAAIAAVHANPEIRGRSNLLRILTLAQATGGDADRFEGSYCGAPVKQHGPLKRTWGAGGTAAIDRNTATGLGPNAGDLANPPGGMAATGPGIDAAQIDAVLNTDLRDKLLDAVSHAMGLFLSLAYFDNVKIMGPIAVGTPGCLVCFELEAFIASAPGVATLNGGRAFVRDAVARADSALFGAWRSHVTIPGLPLYPAFSYVPMDEAPPTPNVPFPLISMISLKLDIILKDKLRNRIITEAIPHGGSDRFKAFAGNLSVALSGGFSLWMASCIPQPIFGFGPVPTSPGSVVGGSVIAAPGAFAVGPMPLFFAPPLSLP